MHVFIFSCLRNSTNSQHYNTHKYLKHYTIKNKSVLVQNITTLTKTSIIMSTTNELK